MNTQPTHTEMSDQKKRQLLRRLTSYAATHTIRISKDEDTPEPYLIGLAMWLKAIESCEATHLLASREMFGAAWATLRLAYECLFYACALIDDPSKAGKLAEAHLAELEKLLPTLEAEGVLESINGGRPSTDSGLKKNSQFKKWSAYDAAKESNLLPLYSEWFRISSQIGAHANVASLDQHLAKDKNGLIRRGARLDRSILLDASIRCLSVGIRRVNERTEPLQPPLMAG